MLRLEWNRLDLGQRLVYLRPEDQKNHASGSVPVNDTARDVLLSRSRFRQEHCPGSRWVFCHKGGRVQSMKRSFANACEKAKIADFRIHDLCHTCAAWLVQDDVPIRARSVSCCGTRTSGPRCATRIWPRSTSIRRWRRWSGHDLVTVNEGSRKATLATGVSILGRGSPALPRAQADTTHGPVYRVGLGPIRELLERLIVALMTTTTTASDRTKTLRGLSQQRQRQTCRVWKLSWVSVDHGAGSTMLIRAAGFALVRAVRGCTCIWLDPERCSSYSKFRFLTAGSSMHAITLRVSLRRSQCRDLEYPLEALSRSWWRRAGRESWPHSVFLCHGARG